MMIQNTKTVTKRSINVDMPERMISAAAGSILLLRGLRKLSLWQIAAGGFMLYRGVTGHCAAYKALDSLSTDDQHESIHEDAVEIVKL